MKKILSFVLAAVMLVMLVGCGKKSFDKNIVFISDSKSISDSRYNTAIKDALDKLDKEAGITYMSAGDAAELAEMIDSAAEKNPGLIILTPGDASDVLYAAAAKYPDIRFAALECKTNGEYANVTGLAVDTAQCGFIAGYTAAACTHESKIGFVGGVGDTEGKSYEAGFRAGAVIVDPNVKIYSEYAGSYADKNAAYSAANKLYSKGVDILYSPAGDAGDGAINYALDNTKNIIAADTDCTSLAPKSVVLSVTIDYARAVTEIAEKYISGESIGGVDILLNVGGDYIQAVRNESLLESNKYATIKYCVNSLKDGTLAAPGAGE